MRPLPLAEAARARLLGLAPASDILLMGEIHGTREVPRIAAALLPAFFARPSPDGRGSRQALALAAAAAVRQGWALLCFDASFATGWAARDRGMARSQLQQRARLGPNRKVVAVCGTAHSRLTPPAAGTHWPSLAGWLRLRPAEPATGHTLALHLPRATAATFLSPPA